MTLFCFLAIILFGFFITYGRKIMYNVEITFIEQLKDEYPEVLTGEVPETNDVGEQSSKPKLEVVNA